jgi:hypothetical protein
MVHYYLLLIGNGSRQQRASAVRFKSLLQTFPDGVPAAAAG